MAATITTRDPAAEAPVPAVAASNVMALYWELASVDPLVRQKAADSLLRALHAFQLQHQASHPSASSTTATEDNLDELCAKDVSYGLKRLLRGLPSSRDGARQGFAVALTELLRGLDFLNVTTVLSLLTKLTQTEGAKGQEEREVLFGRIFGIMAICQAGMLSRPTTTQADIDTIVTSLLKFASSKSYLRETCFRVLLTVVEETKGTALEKGVVDAIIPAVLVNEIENPEDLWFALAMQAAHPEYDWATVLPSWKHSRVLHRKNQTQLIEILKQSTYASPRVHSVWDALFDLLLQNQKESAAAKSSHNVALQDLWIQLDDALYSSTHERKHLGMLLFQRLLARVDSADVAFVFTPQLLRTLINNLAKQDNYLHKVAKQTATVMSKLAKERKEIALQLVLQLVGKNGHQRFDIITKTKTVDTILGSLEEKDILTYVTYLQETFLNQKDAETDPATVQSHRHWALNQMVLLLKNGRIPKAENWVKAVARFVCLHAFYDVQKDDPKDSSVKKPVPAVSEVTRAACIEKLSALLGTLTTMIMKDNSGKPLPAGLMHDHRVWVSDIYSYMTTLSKNTHHVTPAAPLNSAPAKVVAKATSVIDQIQTHTSTLDPVVNREQLSQYRAFELLFVHVLLEVYAGDLEAVGVMEELEDCYKLFFSVKKEKEGKKGGKKRKVEDVEEEEDDEELKPIEVLVDILISFLVKSSGLLRSLSQEVFKVFCGQLTKKALDLILDVLSSKSGVAGAQELFEGEDENGDAMEVDAPAGEGDEEEGADEEGSDDSDSDDDEEESEEDEAATAAGEIDEELRLKIKAAMGKAAPETSDDGETSEEEDFMDDDQMGAFDDKLAEIFRQRKEIKTAARDMKQQVLHFKFRVVDLLEVFVTRASKSPLLVELVVPLSKLLETTGRTAEEADLHKRLEALAKNKLFKVKDVPTEEGGLNVERTVEVLEEVHAYARGASEASTVALCSGASLLLVRILSHCKEPTATSTAVATPTTTPKKSKKRKTEDSTTTTTTTIVPSTLSRVAKVYTTSLTDFMAPKTRLKPVLFLDLVARYPVHAWELVPAIVDLQKSAKPYPYIQSVAILERMVKQMPKKDEDLRLEQLRSVWPAFAGNVIDVLVANGGDSEVEEGGSGSNKVLNKERVKELVRDLVVIARRLNKVFGDDEKSKLWKKEPLEKALNVMCDSERFKTIPSLKKHSQSLVALISPSHS